MKFQIQTFLTTSMVTVAMMFCANGSSVRLKADTRNTWF